MEEVLKEKLKMVLCAELGIAREWERAFGNLGYQSAGIAATAAEAIELVAEHAPDLLIMEPYLSGMNCDELAAYLEQEASPYLVKIVISERKQDLLADRFLSGGGDLFRLQPLDYFYTAKQISLLRETRRRNYSSFAGDRQEQLLREEFSALLRENGMPVSVKGFRYAQEGAILCLQDPSLYRDFRRNLYPLIAASYNTTGTCVERCLRIAIESACKRGDPELFYRRFHPDPESGKVSNKEFISCLIELYKDQQMQR